MYVEARSSIQFHQTQIDTRTTIQQDHIRLGAHQAQGIKIELI